MPPYSFNAQIKIVITDALFLEYDNEEVELEKNKFESTNKCKQSLRTITSSFHATAMRSTHKSTF